MKYGRYEVLEELGQGSMGVVYKAHDPNLDLQVALKVLRPECLQGETIVKRFIAEARVLGRLDHPNIVRVFNVDEDQGTVFIAMEFVEGEVLGALAKKKKLSPREIADLGAQVADALGAAHAKGVIHRDVKPGNILVRLDGRPKITDFGIARIEDTAEHLRTQAGEVLGTPAYMSPEQVLGQPVDPRSDIFSLGIILYELCAGVRPFRGESLGAVFQAITQASHVSVAEAAPQTPPSLAAVIEKCLERDPARRFQSGEELAAALRACFPEGAPAARPAQAAGPPRKRTALWAGAAALVVAAGAAGLFFLAGERRQAPPPASPAVPSPPNTPAAAGALRLATRPAGATVYLDGSAKGTTPLRLEAPPGKHEVRVALAGYEDWEAQVEIAEGGEVPLDVDLAKAPAPASSAPRFGAPAAPAAAKEPTKETPARRAVPSVREAGPDGAVRKALEEGIRNYEKGEIGLSIAILEDVLRRDPGNEQAKKYLALAQERKKKVMEQWRQQLEEAPVSGGKKQ